MSLDFDRDNIKINLFFNRKVKEEYFYYKYHNFIRINLTYNKF